MNTLKRKKISEIKRGPCQYEIKLNHLFMSLQQFFQETNCCCLSGLLLGTFC